MKYFVVSDVHSFFTPLKEALDKEGYDPSNPEHYFISCGDLFDRGEETVECLNYVMSLPKERRIFIKGNHEELLYELIKGKRYPEKCDKTNGTLNTIKQLLKEPNLSSEEIADKAKTLSQNRKLMSYYKELVDYYQVGKYVFVHGWIPYEIKYIDNDTYDLNKCLQCELIYHLEPGADWESARWQCGFKSWNLCNTLKKEGNLIDKNNLTIVCGHWHTSFAHSIFHQDGKEFPDDEKNWRKECNFGVFYDDGIIGLDACTVFTKQVNVVVLED